MVFANVLVLRTLRKTFVEQPGFIMENMENNMLRQHHNPFSRENFMKVIKTVNAKF